MTKFRCGNHKLPVVTGRYEGLERRERICKICNSNNIADEYHYLFECKNKDICMKRDQCITVSSHHNTFKMNHLFNSLNIQELGALAVFLNFIMTKF
jgi:hypothetical protein